MALSQNLLLDGIYGLIIVFVTLLGFITLVWLKDQLMHGAGPTWLQRDNRAVNQLQAQEAQDDLDHLHRHLAYASERARERQQVPERVAAAVELNALHKLVSEQMNKIHKLHRERFLSKVDALHCREMELTYDLDLPHTQYIFLLKRARKKRYECRTEWYSQQTKDYEEVRI